MGCNQNKAYSNTLLISHKSFHNILVFNWKKLFSTHDYYCHCNSTVLYPLTTVADSLPPKVTFCPPMQTIQATGETEFVSWQAPEFNEPRGFELTISSPFAHNWATLGWGNTTVEYIATSTNNNMQATCTFIIEILRKFYTL